MGFGVAGFFVPLTALTLTGIPPEMLASATGLSNFCRILAGSFGTSLSITLWERRANFHHSVLAEHVSAFDPASSNVFGTLASPASSPAMLEQLLGHQAVMLATNDIFWLSGCFFVAFMLMVWLARPPALAPVKKAG
jgi:DHA2 family multidrug resistance protein